MKHLFVPYDLCVLAKEKGFDEPCMGYWATYDDISMPYYIEKQRDHVILAPLYQQLVDWFREQYKIHIWLAPDSVWDAEDQLEEDVLCSFVYKEGSSSQSSWSHQPNLLDIALEEAFELI